jgi:SpoVK/Ycf46/Vps4 family AAA+-type ATPase
VRIHARKRSVPVSEEQISALAHASEGFSGAEIEQAIVSALYAAHASKTPVSAAHILSEIRSTRPLSRVMAEKIGELRDWAAERTVAAD